MKYRSPVAIFVHCDLRTLITNVANYIQDKGLSDNVRGIIISQDWAYDWVARITIDQEGKS